METQLTLYLRLHRCQRMWPWLRFGWLPNRTGPSGCGTSCQHCGSFRDYKRRSPGERPADRCGKGQRWGEKNGHLLQSASFKWCWLNSLITVELICGVLYQLNHAVDNNNNAFKQYNVLMIKNLNICKILSSFLSKILLTHLFLLSIMHQVWVITASH